MGFHVHLLLICLSFWMEKSLSDPRTTEVALICANQSASLSNREVFVANFYAAMEALTSLISSQKYGGVVNGTGNNTVYAFGECMKDLSQTDCNLCFATIKTQIVRCFPFQESLPLQRLIRGGRVFFDGCYVRYDEYMFFNESLSAVHRTVCGSNDYGGNRSVFGANVVELVRNLSLEGPKNGGFAVGSVNRGNVSVYGLAQCWNFVRGTACEECLANSIPNVDLCPPKDEGRVLNSGCYIRYSTQKFYDNSSSDASSGNGGRSNHLGVILASTFAAVAFALFLATIIFFVRKKILKQREKKQFGALLNAVNKSKLYFSYETLEKATNYFHDSNKLGQGGSGSVYKAILPDGQIVAIKRLFFNTRQWVDHFFNEVNLISGIHHNNLVKLLGFSITGPESLLVYEYVPNQSLYDHLFGRRNAQPLNWEARCKILLGTAKGLAYLHEESKLRIIHRDIKLSNVLLEEDFTPKVADFGLARLFPQDESHISTAVAGTLGYLAPEYIVHGKLTEKADLYSFGVLVIEVVSGKRNNVFSLASSSILQMIWDLYGRGRLYDAVDPSLEGNIQKDEASRLLQIGLLCVQASAESRPLMSIVVKMLSDYNFEIPRPTQPPFLNSDSVDQLQQLINPIMNNYQYDSRTHSSGNEITESWIEPR